MQTNQTNMDYRKEIEELIRADIPREKLREHLSDYHENDIAIVLHDLTQEERRKLYSALDDAVLADVFAYLDDAEVYMAELDDARTDRVVHGMDADDMVELLDKLEEEERTAIVDRLPDGVKEDVELISSFDDSLIGSRISTNYIVVPHRFTIKETMRALVSQAAENDNVQTIFVVEEGDVFYGAIALRDLIVARQEQALDDIISTKFPFFAAETPIADCIDEIKDYSEDAIPIVDGERRLIGVITASDIAEVVQEEVADDYAMLAGLTEAEDLHESLFESIRKRLPWLLILLGLSLVGATIIQRFQSFIPTSLVIIYTFQSLILDMSGNTGTQSLAVAIRILSDEKLRGAQIWAFVRKEMRVGVCNGLLVGGLAFVAIGCYLQFLVPGSLAASGLSGFVISGCIGFSLLVAMTIASLGGTVIPLLFKKVGIDPAVVSGPLITTLSDLISVCTYYGLSIALFLTLL